MRLDIFPSLLFFVQVSPIAEYVYLNSQPLAKIDGATVYYYHNDHLATPQKMTDASGQVVWAADYKPFGEATITVSTITNNLRFPGQYYDAETGLNYNYFRDYNPAIGRYISKDPIGLAGGINLYAYVANDPVNWMDLWGLRIQIMGNSQERQYVLDQLKRFVLGGLSIDKKGMLSRSPCKSDESIEADVAELIASERLYRIFGHLYERGWGYSETVPTDNGADIYFNPNVDALYQCGILCVARSTPAAELSHELLGRAIQIERNEPHGSFGTPTRNRSNENAVQRANRAFIRMNMKSRTAY